MNQKQEARKVLARGRRQEDIKKYEALVDSKVPQTLYDKIYESQSEWKKLIDGKLKTAKADVAALDRTLN